jgi:hypothetical protein
MITKIRPIALLPALLLGLSACAAAPSGTAPTQGSVSPNAPAGTPAVEGTLYARDGSVVAAGAQSQQPVRPDAEPKREIGDGAGSRVYLLELYQRSMEEKNALSLEVESLRATLDAERKTAAAAAGEQEKLRTELAQVTLERDGLRTQAFDLAARVTSAQIARLEAEKALLEHKIEVHQREEAAAAKRSGAAPARESKSNGGVH